MNSNLNAIRQKHSDHDISDNLKDTLELFDSLTEELYEIFSTPNRTHRVKLLKTYADTVSVFYTALLSRKIEDSEKTDIYYILRAHLDKIESLVPVQDHD